MAMGNKIKKELFMREGIKTGLSTERADYFSQTVLRMSVTLLQEFTMDKDIIFQGKKRTKEDFKMEFDRDTEF